MIRRRARTFEIPTALVRAAAMAAAAILSLPAPQARAQLAVHDPANYAQNLLQAARALEQLQNQLQSLQNEARHLAPLGLQAAGALNEDLARLNALLAQASRVARDVDTLRGQFGREYPADPTHSDSLMTGLAEARWRNSLASLRRALEVQASVSASLAAANAQALRLAQASEGATGALQAAQAGNQLLAIQSKQLSDLTALLAAQGQAQALEQARAAAAAAEAKARLSRFLGRAP
jgi:type IV secretion system protein TrbJ